MYIKKILVAVLVIGLLLGGAFTYMVYNAVFVSNTSFKNDKAYIYIKSDDTFTDVKSYLEPLLEDMSTFEIVAAKKSYTNNVKGGKYVIIKGANNNDLVNSLRVNNIPVKVSFNNQETLESLAGRIAVQIEVDSISLLNAFNDVSFLKENNFSKETKLGMYLPNSYEFFWNTSAKGFRDKMLKEYKRFWSQDRLDKANALNMSPMEIISLAAIVHKETAKIDERPRVAGLYLNRVRDRIPLQADPTVIYALKLTDGDFSKVYKRVLYKDLKIDSPYNTYKYAGVPPGPITMPDISAIDAVLNAEKHNYYYMVANVKNFGYHKFAETLAQHNRNKVQYIQWINAQNIKR